MAAWLILKQPFIIIITMIHYLKIIRPLNCLITFLSVVVAAFIASEDDFPITRILLAALSASLIAAAGYVINDYYDVEIDKSAHPERPLARGFFTKTEAVLFYNLLNLSALAISFWLGLIEFIFVLLTITLLYLYSVSIKKIILVGNYIISWLTGMVFIFGGIVVGNAAGALIPALFAFLINFIREIVKDIQDIEGDLKMSVTTFPAKYGIKKALTVISFLSVFMILSTFYPFLSGYYKIEYFVVVMIIVNPLMIYFLKSIYKDQSGSNLQKMSWLLKLNMIFGLAAIFLGK